MYTYCSIYIIYLPVNEYRVNLFIEQTKHDVDFQTTFKYCTKLLHVNCNFSIYDRPTTCHTEESLPLSEREKFLLQNAQALEQQSTEHAVSRDVNSSERISRSCDDILETDSYPDEKPPPKPPLPPNVESLLRK